MIKTALKVFFDDFDSILDLEERISPFNIFEALGVARAEIRHSNFLAYLLDPNRKHGLGEEFLTRFLYRALLSIDSTDPVAAEVMIADIDQVQVEREREGIDVLLTIHSIRLVVAIENKIDAAETGDQLARYFQWVEQEYGSGWRRIYLFLSPDGREASHEAWYPISYSIVVDSIDWLLRTRGSNLSADLMLTMKHYHEMLERNVLDEDKNRDVARQLYLKHKEVFDFVFSSIPKVEEETLSACMALVNERGDLFALNARQFKSSSWLGKAIIGKAKGEPAQAVYFELSPGQEMKLVLYLGPGPKDYRARLYNAAKAAGAPFSPNPEFTPQWTYLLRTTILAKAERTQKTPAQCAEIARERLNNFLNEHLQTIDDLVLSVVVGED